MSLDGFIAGPGHAMSWIFDFLAPDAFPATLASGASHHPGRIAARRPVGVREDDQGACTWAPLARTLHPQSATPRHSRVLGA
jgi:hypothetical protein